jgi:uncharacterized membrane protein YhhN
MYRFVRKNIFTIYWLIVLLGIISLLFFPNADVIFKPLLMPALIAAIFLLTNETRGRLLILAALFFSFLGDVFLMLEDKSSIFFIAGLASFLITHIFYIVYFSKLIKPGPSPARKHFYIPFVIIAYAVSLLYLIYPNLEDLKIPVIAYASVLMFMLYCSFALPYSLNKMVGQLFILGAVFFTVSDSLLAINKFYQPFGAASILVRFTYCIAQYFIVRAFIKKRY